ncbi:hypothetical protein H4R18_004842 [Coemansia javaensis]|uniref:C2H2-type domain-containing protein n=1 Tax=Coemansia javaensis TaxID=2761396 RepID=A0A9W8HAG8_9FUNG|nr:hypothetical protein H4R18_004842 [Coemansia javaensis]
MAGAEVPSAGVKVAAGGLDVLTLAASKASAAAAAAAATAAAGMSTVAPQIPDALVVVPKIRRGRPKRSEQEHISAIQQALVTREYQRIVDQIAHDASEDNGGRRRRFVCTVAGCGKVFYQRAHLNIHIRSHTGYKPYACQHPGCGKSFPQLGNMRTHERTHTGDRPFKCHIAGCQRAFTQRGNLKTHLRKVHQTDGALPKEHKANFV